MWEICEGTIYPLLMPQEPAPRSPLEIVSCKCKLYHCRGRCSCSSEGLPCTAACLCEGEDACRNAHKQINLQPRDSDTDSSDNK